MKFPLTREDEVFGLVHPAIDVHTLGITSVAALLEDCKIRCVVSDEMIRKAVESPAELNNMTLLKSWIRRQRITRLGFSYRLDPQQGVAIFKRLFDQICNFGLLAQQGGPIRGIYFAGLPEACRQIRQTLGDQVEVFSGEETRRETLDKLGILSSLRPTTLSTEVEYDELRLVFAREWIEKADFLKEGPIDHSGYEGFGSRRDRVVDRLRHAEKRGLLPLMRAHMGPYLADRNEGVRLCLEWCRELALDASLDILSVGTSQLTQSHFGQVWGQHPNGGGVPVNSPEEYRLIWKASRPMLVRTYAGTRGIPQLARMYEETINMAWHAFSFWWFCQIDGRGPLSVRENLEQHIEGLRIVRETGKPFEPNIPHHFSFRGGDDITYVVSAVLAARTAKLAGVRYLILQNMLNTPKSTWGIQDLAKSRAMLSLVRELEDQRFRVFLQPRAGLDYFSPDLNKARIQLAAVSALMDDIEPLNCHSPQLIHVVSFSEGSYLADPSVINESIKITRGAIAEYRRLKAVGEIPDMSSHREVSLREEQILSGARTVLRAIEDSVTLPYTARGLYQIFAAGFLPVPLLQECRDEFQHAVQWRTKLFQGGVKVVDATDRIVNPEERAKSIAERLRTESKNLS